MKSSFTNDEREQINHLEWWGETPEKLIKSAYLEKEDYFYICSDELQASWYGETKEEAWDKFLSFIVSHTVMTPEEEKEWNKQLQEERIWLEKQSWAI